jgi:prevent-host-death family protein
MNISIADAHNRLSQWLKYLRQGPVTITRRGKPVGVIIDPAEYERLHQVEAYLQLLDISHELGEGASADEIYRLSRQELEQRA